MEEFLHGGLVGLPSTHLDLGLFGIGHVHHQEETAYVTVCSGIIELLYLNAKHLVAVEGLERLDVVVGKFYVDVFVAWVVEAFLKVRQIGVLGIAV